jgi:hypothetical protein
VRLAYQAKNGDTPVGLVGAVVCRRPGVSPLFSCVGESEFSDEASSGSGDDFQDTGKHDSERRLLLFERLADRS